MNSEVDCVLFSGIRCRGLLPQKETTIRKLRTVAALTVNKFN